MANGLRCRGQRLRSILPIQLSAIGGWNRLADAHNGLYGVAFKRPIPG